MTFVARNDFRRRTGWFQFWDQHELPFIRLIPITLLVASCGLDIATNGGVTAHVAVDLCLAAAAGVWLLLSYVAVRRAPRNRLLLGAMFAGMIALNAALVVRSPIFGFYTFTGYAWVFRMLFGRWRVAGIAAVAATSAISQTGGAPGTTAGDLALFAVVFAINVGVAGAVMWFGFVGHQQQAQARAGDRRADRGQPAPRGTPGPARGAGAGGRHRVGAPAARARDPRHARPGVDRDHHPAPGGGRARGGELRAGEHIDAAIALARESLSEARRSVRELAPEPLESARLPDALADVAARWSALHGVEVSVQTTGTARAMPPEAEVALLRTAQEALANVAKHARAERVGLTLSYMEDQVTLDVRDDGIGFGTGAARAAAGGFGLAAMRQRIARVAGTLEIESEHGGGTAVCASVPVGSDR